MTSKQFDTSPCPVCGGITYRWGTITSQGIRFVADDTSWLKKQFGFGIKLRARKCQLCLNIQIFDNK